jgi:hypothetical protein
MAPIERRTRQKVENDAGGYVVEEPIDSALMASATTGDVLTVKADDTVHPRTITGAGGIAITVNADEIEVDGSAISAGGALATLYDSGALGSPAASIDTGAAGIAGGYNVLEVFALLRLDQAVANGTTLMRFNGDSSTSNYFRQRLTGANTTASAGINNGAAGIDFNSPGSSSIAGSFGPMRCSIPFYAETTAHKSLEMTFGNGDTTDANKQAQVYVARWDQTTAISQISFHAPAGQNFIAGSHVIIYGR